MKSVQIIDPTTNKPFDQFTHGTTTYVSVPHDHPSELVVAWEVPCTVCIQRGSEKLAVPTGSRSYCTEAPEGFARIVLSDLKSPANPHRISDWVKELVGKHGCPQLRLYKFEAVIEDGKPDELSKFKFHVLCPADYAEADKRHLELLEHPDCLGCQTIEQCCEGRSCTQCGEVRKSLKA